MPPQSDLRELLKYEPDTGLLFWLPRPLRFFTDGKYTSTRRRVIWNNRFAGAEAFTDVDGAGYRAGTLLGVRCNAHRIIFKIMTGEEPPQVDHINGNPVDNRWSNLRAATRKENSRNKALPSNNKSGVVGVSWIASRNAWIAQIGYENGTKWLGSFKTKTAAIAARKRAEEKLGYHRNHGTSRPSTTPKRRQKTVEAY